VASGIKHRFSFVAKYASSVGVRIRITELTYGYDIARCRLVRLNGSSIE